MTDRLAAEEVAAELRRQIERRVAGVVTQADEHGARPLTEHLEAFEVTLQAREVVEQYVEDLMGQLRAFANWSGAKGLRDLDAARASKWIAEERARGLSARSVNRRIAALRSFTRWATATDRMERDPFLTLKRLNEATDRRHVRRALTPEEVTRLLRATTDRPLAAARSQRTTAGVSPLEEVRLRASGEARAFLYALALGTGLRRGELRRLRWGDVDFERGLLTVRAESAKARRVQSVPLRADLAAALRERQGDARAGDSLVPRRTFPNLRTFKRDLLAAGIATQDAEDGAIVARDEEGREVDFHCLRVTFCTRLSAAGVHPRVAMELARHSRLDLTMRTYTDPVLLNTRAAIESLTLHAGGEGLSRLLSHSAHVSPPLVASPRPEEAPPEDARIATERGRERRGAAKGSGGRYWARTSDPQLVELVLYQLS